MLNTIQVECPSEILIGSHMDADDFSSFMKLRTAIALFGEGKLSSGMAVRWVGMPRVHFLLMAMQEGLFCWKTTMMISRERRRYFDRLLQHYNYSLKS